MALLHSCTPNSNVYLVICTRMMKESVICLVNVLFCVTYWNKCIFENNKETHRSCACFQLANTRPGRMFCRVCMLKASTGLVCLFAICTTFIYYISICNTKQYINQTQYAVLCHSRTYNNVYISIGSTCM